MEMKRIELKELVREILLTEIISVEPKIKELGKLSDEVDGLIKHLEGLKKILSYLNSIKNQYE
jgi:hypothetical protein